MQQIKIIASLVITVCLTIIASKKLMFLISFIKADVIHSEETHRRVNILARRYYQQHPMLMFIFTTILFAKAKIFLKKASKEKKFISLVNLLITRYEQFTFTNKDRITKRLCNILQKYDFLLKSELDKYESKKPKPVTEFLLKVIRFRKLQPDSFELVGKAGQERLIYLLGNLILNPKHGTSIESDDIEDFQPLLGESTIFMQHVLSAVA